jgi:aerobic-type carbon monoxide dehydrogenase small subunit (CoxS/CutS family)
MEQTIRFKLNNRPMSLTTDGDRALLWVLRTDLGMTGAKFGCGHNQCGACTVVVDGEAVRSCQYPVRNVSGKEVLTIEGLADGEKLHPLQKAFMQHGAIQCGFCTPGMILKSYSLLLSNTRPSRTEIIEGMEQNLCRCGAHSRIIEAIQTAAAELEEGRHRGKP